jgi:peptidoglycan-associated lipoprotein
MKTSKLSVYFVIALALALTVVGCRTKERPPTPLGDGTSGRTPGGKDDDTVIDPGVGPKVKPKGEGPNEVPLDPNQLSNKDLTGRTQNREMFQNETAYFEFDRATVKASETSKADAVAAKFKALSPAHDLLVEGHCDERGTEEYNRALGESRALALRLYLINAGVPASRVHTKSFGKDKPAAPGHDEAAWSKNRRGEFILILPK